MKLFVDSNYLSPYAMSVFVALREKHLPFETVLVNLERQEQSDPLYAEVSTTRRVPAISDDGFHLSESSAICEYLEDRYPGTALYPSDIQSKARAREIQAWLRSDLLPIRQERSAEVVFLKRSPPPPLSAEAQTSVRKLIAATQSFLQPGRTSLFDQWSIADTDLALMLNRLRLAGDTLPARLAAYAEAQWQRPSVQEWVNKPRPAC
ncbi:glutathione transferase [Aquabacterium sp.]|uniref:glutathione transferase n=1 Tax=Aquabacterium sp. TaxID=1872578 RepID=UPI003D05FF24